MDNKTKAFRGPILHFLSAPSADGTQNASYQYISDGLLVVAAGKIQAMDTTAVLRETLPADTEIVDCSQHLIVPGFIDTHIHYAQTEIIASYGKQLLEWLEKYVFPAEKQYGDIDHAVTTANFFLRELLRNGTTTALVYATVHAVSAEVLFRSAAKLHMRLLTGKTMMDRNAPAYLLDTPQQAYNESKRLLQQWHGKDRLAYAITPRFAPTSTEAQLEVAAALLQEFPTAYLQTHLAENRNEVNWVSELFPWSKDYTDIYDHYNLLGPRSIFGHTIFLSAREFDCLSASKSVCSWCPTSNFFLGSGLFDLGRAKAHGVRIGIGTDVGGGSSFSMLVTLNEAYKTAALQGTTLSPLEGFYYMTLGNAQALSIDDKVGNFLPGKEADFLVLDLASTPLLADKMARAQNLEEQLFNLIILGDDRVIKETYVLGELKYARDAIEE